MGAKPICSQWPDLKVVNIDQTPAESVLYYFVQTLIGSPAAERGVHGYEMLLLSGKPTVVLEKITA
jgi:hypothetical protein